MSYIAPERTQTHTFVSEIPDNTKLLKTPKSIAGYIYVLVALILVAVTTFVTSWLSLMGFITPILLLIGLFITIDIREQNEAKIFKHNYITLWKSIRKNMDEIDEIMEPYIDKTNLTEERIKAIGCEAVALFQDDLKNKQKHTANFTASTYEETEDGVKRTKDGADFTCEIISENEVRITIKLP